MNSNIIGFAGRKGSGKTTIANILIELGFKRISFADWLKDTTCNIFSLDRAELDNIKNNILEPFKISELKITELIINNPELIKFKENLETKTFTSYREFLQWFGSDVCRVIDFDWHVKKTIQIIKNNPNIKYVCDDIRFLNEKESLEKLGGQVFFVISPWNWDISNHISEVSIQWQNFNQQHIIINDRKLIQIQKYYKAFFTRLVDHSDPWHELVGGEVFEYLEEGIENYRIGLRMDCSRDKIVWWSNRLNFKNKRTEYSSDNNAFNDIDPTTAYLAGLLSADGCIKCSGPSISRYVLDFGSIDKELVDNMRLYLKTEKPIYIKKERIEFIYDNAILAKEFYYIINENPFILENLKKWNLAPRKSMKEQIPYMIINNMEFLYDWLRGIIDGDGSVFINNHKDTGRQSFNISFLTSKEIGDWLTKEISIQHCYNNHKKYETLMEFKFNGNYAYEFAKKVYGFPHCVRKWNIYKEYYAK